MLWIWIYLLNSILILLCGEPELAKSELSVQILYEQGAFCQLVEVIRSRKVSEIQEDDPLSEHLILVNACVKMEEWIEVETQIEGLKTLNWAQFSNNNFWSYQILRAKYLSYLGHGQRADSIFKSFLVQSPGISDSLVQSTGLFEYGHQLLQRQQYNLAQEQLQSANNWRSKPGVLKTRIISAIGFLLLEKSEYISAQAYFNLAAEYWSQSTLRHHPERILFLSDYALFHLRNGALNIADSLLTESEKLLSEACIASTSIGYIAAARAYLLFELGDHEGALKQHERAYSFFESVNNVREMAVSAFNKAEINFFLNRIETARSQYEEATRLSSKAFSNEYHPFQAQILLGKAALESYEYADSLANQYYDRAIMILEQSVGQENNFYSTAINNYAFFHENIGELGLALEGYLKARSIDSLLLGTYHQDYNRLLFNIARCHVKMGNITEARNQYRQANEIQLKRLHSYFSDFDERTRLSYRLEAMGHFDAFFSYACQLGDALTDDIQNINLATKNLALDYAIKGQKYRPSGTADNTLFEKWIQLRKRVSHLYLSKNNLEQSESFALDSLEEAIAKIEVEIGRRFGSTSTPPALTAQNLRTKLEPNEAAIDFFNYHVTDEYGKVPDSVRYYALITRSDWPNPKLVYLCTQDELTFLLNASTHYTSNAEIIQRLFEQIWMPLDTHLTDVEVIHLSPEGALHEISFATLFNRTDDRLLGERFEFHYYSNLSDFILPTKNIKTNPSIYLVGNPDYGQVGSKVGAATFWQPLKGTIREINEVAKICANAGWEVSMDIANNASEANFYRKIEQDRPTIVHLATHGFFLQQDTLLAEETTLGRHLTHSSLPMIRSGFVLSGVNHTWNTSSEPTYDDGIITALDLSIRDLSSVSLMTLSACESGRGLVADGEGVFGLQRAIKQAGVSQLLISLWPVPDHITALLMEAFYSNLAADTASTKALSLAQELVRREYPNPYYWGAFVLFE
ncbi:MAG: CHAT domain-containing protein [Saprospiraceae bacterium]|nr:CHAT domain-containing protein [Saprospiraceae bacterium]